jgi:Serine hydrolase (FSH1)
MAEHRYCNMVFPANKKQQILCLHGMGSNAQIFKFQTRQFQLLLDPHFNFFFVDAPIPCEPGPEILPTFDGCGPFRRWTCPGDRERQEKILIDLHQLIDDAASRGQPFAAVMGFSEGASVATGLMLDQQERWQRKFMERDGPLSLSPKFCYAVLLCGGTNPPFLPSDHDFFHPSSQINNINETDGDLEVQKISVPPVHVLGLSDSRLPDGQDLLKRFYDASTSSIFEWDGGHQLPTSTEELATVLRSSSGAMFSE